MNVSELMSHEVHFCRVGDTLQRAAQIMWEHDCGCVPIVDGEDHVMGIVTDRDACMAAYTQGRPLSDIEVMTAAATEVASVSEADSLERAELLMQRARVHRLPVVDANRRLRGMLSLNDLARHAHARRGRHGDGLTHESVVKTLGAICAPRP